MISETESHRTEDVLMLFRYTENPPENPIFPPTALWVSAGPSGYTENSSFPYIPNVVALTPAALLLLTPSLMLWPQGLLLDRQRPLVERLGLGVFALGAP